MGAGNRVLVAVVGTPGAGTIDLGAPDAGYISFGDNFSDQAEVEYFVEDGEDWEHGIGTFGAAGPSLARTTIIETLDAGVYDDSLPAAISLTASAKVYISPSIDRVNSKLSLAGGIMEGRLSLVEYDEGSANLNVLAGVVTVPLDGKRYRVQLSENVTLAVSDVPAFPRNGNAEIDIVQNITGGWTCDFPADWEWDGGTVRSIGLGSNERTRVLLSTTTDGTAIDVDLSVRG